MKKASPFMFASFLIFLFAGLSAGYAAPSTPNSQITITDIAGWKHPVKAVFQKYKISLTKVIMINNKTYPIFYVNLPSGFGAGTAAFYQKVFQEAARANAYWDYQLIDGKRDVSFEVFCDRKARKVQNVNINGDTAYYGHMLSGKLDNAWDRVIRVLNRNVPEIAEYRKLVQNASTEQHQKVDFIIRQDGVPDPTSSDTYLRDYYMVYIGESHENHTVRWNTFLVGKNLTEILVDDPLTGKYISLSEWRKNKDEKNE